MQNQCGYDARKVNSARKLSGCIQREKSKIILALRTDNKQMETFEKTLSGGFSCVSTRLAFDSKILLPNLTEKDSQKMNIDQSFKAYKRDDLKLIYKIKLDNQENYSKKRVITKILKFDENNQYGFGMTKPMPTSCIKEKELLSWLDFQIVLETVDLDGSLGRILLLIYFLMKNNATEMQLLYNESFPPIIEKYKTLDANERSAYQLLELFDKNKDDQDHIDVQSNLMPLYSTLFGRFKIFD